MRAQGGNPEQFTKSMDGLKTQFAQFFEKHEKQIGQLEGRQKAMDSEYESMLEIKVSNQVRGIKQSLNERLQQISDDFATQTKSQLGELRDKVHNFDVQTHQMKLQLDSNTEKLQSVDKTLSEQVDIMHNLNDKLASEISKSNGNIGNLEKRFQQMEERFVDLVNETKAGAGLEDQFRKLMEMIKILQKNDHQEQEDIKFLKNRLETEIESKLTLIIRNRDDLLKRIEAAEAEMEKMNTEAAKRISRAEQALEKSRGVSDDQLRLLVAKVEKIELDVTGKYDQKLRQLEATDNSMQKEILDMGESIRSNQKNIDDFRNFV